jgi:hypothetical protein
MKSFFMAAVLGMFLAAAAVQADSGNLTNDARAILHRVVANRPARDFVLKARLLPTREESIPLEILVKNSAADTRTIYRATGFALLVIQPVQAEPRFYLGGTNELTGLRRTERLLGSHFTYYDLGVPFLRWPNEKFLGEDIMRGQGCFVLETAATNAPYARVKMWIHKDYFALLRAEAFDDGGALVKRFAITSFKKIGDVWIPRGVEIAYVPPGQALPAQEKSRLEIYEGNYDTQLPAEWFLPERFAELKDAPARTLPH